MTGPAEQFARRAQALGAVVQPIPRAGVRAVLPADAGATASAREWLGADVRPARLDQRDVVVLGRFGVVESGSVALIEPVADRACALLAERLIVLLPADRLIASLVEALATGYSLAAPVTAPLLLLSGPSRTGDIERVLTIGVHGPAALTILLIGEL